MSERYRLRRVEEVVTKTPLAAVSFALKREMQRNGAVAWSAARPNDPAYANLARAAMKAYCESTGVEYRET